MTATFGRAQTETNDAWTQTLESRARRLAQAPEDVTRTEVSALCFRLGNERYAVGLELLRSVLRPGALTSVPCAPPHIAGILNVRGEIVTVVDLAIILGLSKEQAPSPECWVLLVQVPQARIGLLVDEVLDMTVISQERLDPALSAREFVAGIYEGRTTLLDLALLLTRERLEVGDRLP